MNIKPFKCHCETAGFAGVAILHYFHDDSLRTIKDLVLRPEPMELNTFQGRQTGGLEMTEDLKCVGRVVWGAMRGNMAC